MKIVSIVISIILSFVTIHPQNKEISELINELGKTELFRNSSWSVYAEYTDNGKEIVAFKPDMRLAPASNLKVVTSGVAINLLGSNYRYETKLYFDGEINNNGELYGNVYLVGNGDPTLGSDRVKGSSNLQETMSYFISAIKEKGIKKIVGNIVADDLFFERDPIPDYWPWTDIGNYYGTGTSGLCINDNLYYLYFKPGKNVGDSAVVLRTVPNIYNLKFINYMKTGKEGSGDNGYIFNAPNSFEAILRGTIPVGVEEFSIKGSMPNPPLFAVQLLKENLLSAGIIVEGKAEIINNIQIYDNEKLICSKLSPELKDIIFVLNKRSDNLYTEQLLKTIAKQKTGIGNTEKGIDVIMNFLKTNSIPSKYVKLYDGSGLSRTNMITTKTISKFLSFMSKQNQFEQYYFSFPVAGDPDDEGSFKKFGIGTLIEKNARIKSGTINGVRAFSGYIKDKKGRLISFSMIANNYFGSSKEVDEAHKKILIKLSDLE